MTSGSLRPGDPRRLLGSLRTSPVSPPPRPVSAASPREPRSHAGDGWRGAADRSPDQTSSAHLAPARRPAPAAGTLTSPSPGAAAAATATRARATAARAAAAAAAATTAVAASALCVLARGHRELLGGVQRTGALLSALGTPGICDSAATPQPPPCSPRLGIFAPACVGAASLACVQPAVPSAAKNAQLSRPQPRPHQPRPTHQI